jgi:cellulose synthase/poly-beta-1,6-N-acetylglucosamine synthase-like glycosyltransferase
MRIATVSNDSARQIAQYLPVRAADIAVLPNGHEHVLSWDPTLARIAPSLVTKSCQDPKRGFVLALGSRARHKNLQLLLNAAPSFAEIGLDVIVVGGGAGIFAPASLCSAPNVHVSGYVTDHDLAYLMDRAVCLAFPSWTEGFGLPILEAMARGCAVVSSDRASMPEICGGAALMASPDDPAAWVRQVRAFVESPDLKREFAERGRERARMYSWNDTAAGYIELMRDPAVRSRPRNTPQPALPNVAVVVATRGRPAIVTATLQHLIRHQTCKPVAVIVSCVTPEDAGEASLLPGVRVVTGAAGLAAQRNAALDALPAETEIVAFFDDDFVAAPGWLAAAAETFRDDPEVAGFTGHVLADGIKGPGFSFSEAVRILETESAETSWSRIEPYSPYGCNMAFRISMIQNHKFDERLVLYGWLEDRDFGASVANCGGRLVKCANARGVHMGIKSGRVAGERLGYSQVVNPLYMLRKGTMTVGQVSDHLLRNITSNVARALKPEPFIDRRGRLKGNIRGFIDLLRGRLDPERAAAIQLRKES